MKCVMVVDETLPTGLVANTTAALGLSLGHHVQGLSGPDVTDQDGVAHKGITAVPIPVLTTGRDEIRALYSRCLEQDDGLLAIGFSDVAQRNGTYDGYMDAMGQMPTSSLAFLGICIYGPRRSVNRLCGQLKLLR